MSFLAELRRRNVIRMAGLKAKGFPAMRDKYDAPDMCTHAANGGYICE